MQKDKSCFIDVISKEAILRNKSKLDKAKINTFPIITTTLNKKKKTSHAEMFFYYKGDTWFYSNQIGSIRVLRKRKGRNIKNMVKRIYSFFYPEHEVLSVHHMDYVEFFS